MTATDIGQHVSTEHKHPFGSKSQSWVDCSCGWGTPVSVSLSSARELFGKHLDDVMALAVVEGAEAAWMEIVNDGESKSERRARLRHLERVLKRPTTGSGRWESLARADAHVGRCGVCGTQCWNGSCTTCALFTARLGQAAIERAGVAA